MYKLDELHDRSNNQSIKWGMVEELFGAKDILPLWVADMDFKTAPPIIEALSERVEEGIYGYTKPEESYFNSFINWCRNRHQWEIDLKELLYSPGVVPALIFTIESLTEKNDRILIQTPVYGPFARSINDHHRRVVENPLLCDNGYYTMDFDHMEAQFQEGVKVMIFCSPHNPVGRVWQEHELLQLTKLIEKYDILVISDEIHSDLILKGYKHTPLASFESIKNKVITCMAPSKTFNLAGLQSSIIHTYNQDYLDQLKITYEKMDMKINNCFGQVAFEAAYNHGQPWLEAVLSYIEDNIDYCIDYINNHIEGISVRKPEGTYLLWLDCRSLNMSHEALKTFMAEKAKVGLTDGGFFGDLGEGYMRLNVATPRANIVEGLRRISDAVKAMGD